MFILTDCATGEAQRQDMPYQSVKSLELDIKGTKNYITLEAPTGTIDQYSGMYDSTKLPDNQVGFRLQVPLSIKNVGDEQWHDPAAVLTLTIIDPNGNPTKVQVKFKEAKIMKRTYVGGQKVDSLELTSETDRALDPNKKRVYFFSTDYIPKTEGNYIVNTQLESLDKIRGILIARSSLTFTATTSDSEYIKLPSTCSPYKQCAGIQVCCSKGVNIPTEDIIGHCADQCIAGEKEVPYIIKLS